MANSRHERFLEAEKSIRCSNKIEKYLIENCESKRDLKFEIFGWWKANLDRYQVLSKMARDVLAIPVSTVASKLVFSTGGYILDPFQSSLSSHGSKSYLCSKLAATPYPNFFSQIKGQDRGLGG